MRTKKAIFIKVFLLLILNVRVLFAYTDLELENLWASLSDINNPTLEDYRLIESYLKNGERPPLKVLYNTAVMYGMRSDFGLRMQQRRDFKLVGPNGEMPVFELHQIGVTEETKDRCILIYCSYNRSYPKKARLILEELKECGYSGNVMLRIGGFPNLAEGGIKFCPYFGVWKNEFIKEALSMGFRKILHIDTSIHPMNDLNSVFETLDAKGYYALCQDNLCPYFSRHQHLDYLRIPPEMENRIPWLPGYILGFNFNDERAAQLFYAWDFATKNVEHFDHLDREEVIMTILTWQHGLPPTGGFYNHVLVGHYHPDVRKSSRSNSIEFYFDTLRN